MYVWEPYLFKARETLDSGPFPEEERKMGKDSDVTKRVGKSTSFTRFTEIRPDTEETFEWMMFVRFIPIYQGSGSPNYKQPVSLLNFPWNFLFPVNTKPTRLSRIERGKMSDKNIRIILINRWHNSYGRDLDKRWVSRTKWNIGGTLRLLYLTYLLNFTIVEDSVFQTSWFELNTTLYQYLCVFWVVLTGKRSFVT